MPMAQRTHASRYGSSRWCFPIDARQDVRPSSNHPRPLKRASTKRRTSERGRCPDDSIAQPHGSHDRAPEKASTRVTTLSRRSTSDSCANAFPSHRHLAESGECKKQTRRNEAPHTTDEAAANAYQSRRETRRPERARAPHQAAHVGIPTQRVTILFHRSVAARQSGP
jgi:hypothetical protein